MMRPHQRKKIKKQIEEGWTGRREEQLRKNKKNCQRVKDWKLAKKNGGVGIKAKLFERSTHLEQKD